MATTQKFYRLRKRNVRISTQLQTASYGMYLTNQNIPEGYMKVLVNYDIDDTGSCIKTRKGRELLTTLPYPGVHHLGRMHATDYIYTYNEALDEVEDIKDVLFSLGSYTKLSDNINPSDLETPEYFDKPIYLATLEKHYDTSIYDENEQLIEEGSVYAEILRNSWGIYCDKGSEDFHEMYTGDVGYTTARTIKNAYAYDKKLIRDLGRPVYTILDNEIYAFAAPVVVANLYPSNQAMSKYTSLSKPRLSKLIPQKTDYGYSFKRKVLEPKTLDPEQASTKGFNLLHDSPYEFSDAEGGSPRILGFFPYKIDEPDIPVSNFEVNTNYNMRVYYQYATTGLTYKYKVEILDASAGTTDYETIIDWTAITTGNPILFNISFPYVKTNVRITIRKDDDTNTESQSPWTYDCNADPRPELKEFDFTTAKGLVSWFNHIGVWGIKDATDTIFFSDVEDASYFPSENYISFDNQITAVHNYLDMLLVITTDSIIIIKAGSSITDCTQKKLMTNIFIPELDAVNVIVLKNQIFFKTDTQFYVLKNNQYTSDATDLKNYVNSTAIANYTVNFTEETIKILNKVFRPITDMVSKERRKIMKFTDFNVIDVQSAVKNEEVHYVYTIVPYIEEQSFGNLNLHLVYNTVNRSYRMYFKGIGDDNVSHTALLYRNKQSGIYYEIIPYNLPTDSNILIVKDSLKSRDDNIIQGDWQLTPYYNNYNYLDTGNVALDDIATKRFRELQLNVVSHEHSKIKYFADIKVDGKLNIDSTEYEVQNITDPDDPEYGLVYVTPTSVDNLTVYGDTTLEDEESELIKYWEIDLSAFPDLDTVTVRFKLWGRGRRVSLQLLCTELKYYELSTFVWVYRVMNVR